MENRLFKQVCDFEDHIAREMDENMNDMDVLIALAGGYACAYIPFFEEVKTDASDSMMLLKIFMNTLKKIERAVIVAAIRGMDKTLDGDKNE